MRGYVALASALVILALDAPPARAQTNEVIPHAQDRPPGPALSPAEAIAKMKVPEGFAVELVASEPDLVNPVAMTFDERGRIWVTESLEYPRREPGPGRDRIKVLEDTDGDGKADRFTVFADGLNIPSGIAVGHGGVWVANAPDILFLRDTDGDGKADTREVVVTGFGRDDTHELPNSLTWGPDGWLYGWNGVFNRSVVKHRGRTFDFTCAIFRIHPRTRDFELFCEGTSNPWGIAIDPEGSFFASACVIDHLWHLVETGYYHRQGGPYPPFTWKIESIVDHKHQKAAYCGIHYFDSDAYPPEYRGRLYMGNIHGNCVNVDALERQGSTYRAKAAPDFLAANDAWFMPVVQKTGPDGCLYILDWYDRYHCYQDANRDPAGIDRLKGRLYRVRYKDTPRRAGFDLARKGDDELIELLGSANVYDRDIAQRLLDERLASRPDPKTRETLEGLVFDQRPPSPTLARAGRHALWTLVSSGPLGPESHRRLLAAESSNLRAWGVRAAGNQGAVEPAIRDRVAALAGDPAPDVRLQVAIAARKVRGLDPVPLLMEVLSASSDDPLIPHIVWQNLHPLLEDQGGRFVDLVQASDPKAERALAAIMPRAIDRILGRRSPDPGPAVALVKLLVEGKAANPAAAGKALGSLAEKVQTGEIAGDRLAALRNALEPVVGGIIAGRRPPVVEATDLAASWGDPKARAALRLLIADPLAPESARLRALAALMPGAEPETLDVAVRLITDSAAGSADFRGKALAALGRLDDPRVAKLVLDAYPRLGREVQPRAIELLTQRPAWSRALLAAVGAKAIPAEAMDINLVRRLQGSKDPEIIKAVKATWGTVREGRNPKREQVVREMREFLRATPGDPSAGQRVFQKLCAQCHKIYGEGQEVGPDITGVGRSDFDQLVSNVFDPSLVIGAAYQATTVATADGRVLTGLLAEDSKERVVLKLQGGKQEIIPRAEVEAVKVSPLSLMAEEIENQLTRQEWADLFAFLELDKPPTDPTARRLPNTPEPKPRPAGGR
jgi:putative membrane-bound dehydrogenase-like protein